MNDFDSVHCTIKKRVAVFSLVREYVVWLSITIRSARSIPVSNLIIISKHQQALVIKGKRGVYYRALNTTRATNFEATNDPRMQGLMSSDGL